MHRTMPLAWAQRHTCRTAASAGHGAWAPTSSGCRILQPLEPAFQVCKPQSCRWYYCSWLDLLVLHASPWRQGQAELARVEQAVSGKGYRDALPWRDNCMCDACRKGK